MTVTGAAGNIGYALVFMIAQGRMFGPRQTVSLTLLEIPQAEQSLKGVLMELKDCAFPLLKEVKGATNYKDGFEGCQVAVLVGARPRGPGMEVCKLFFHPPNCFFQFSSFSFLFPSLLFLSLSFLSYFPSSVFLLNFLLPFLYYFF